ncbi:MAG: DsbA family protein [Sphingomonadales bacterium]
MEHNRKQFKPIFNLALAGALSLVLAACDNSTEPEGAAEASSTAEAYTGPDYSQVVSGGEVKGTVVFGDITVGNPDAPITMIEYASMTCSHCATFHNSVLPEIKENYVKTGKVKMVFRNFIRDRMDLAVAMVTRCYGPDKTFDLMNLYFQRQRQWAVQDAMAEITNVARTAGISRLDLDSCLANSELQAHLLEMQKAGSAAGVNATPTFFINGEKYVGAGNYEIFSEMFEDELN